MADIADAAQKSQDSPLLREEAILPPPTPPPASPLSPPPPDDIMNAVLDATPPPTHEPPPPPQILHSSRKGVIIASLLLLLLTLPLTIYFVSLRQRITEQSKYAGICCEGGECNNGWSFGSDENSPVDCGTRARVACDGSLGTGGADGLKNGGGPCSGGGSGELPAGDGPICSPVGKIEYECPADNPTNRCHQCGSNNKWIQSGAPGCQAGNPGYFQCNACTDPDRVCYQEGGDDGGGTGQCPPDQVIWCATFDCPLGDEDRDGECNPNPNPTRPGDTTGDPHATYTTQWGKDCPNPASGCGQVDKYNNGTPGVDWVNYCGTKFINFANCTGTTPTPTTPPAGSCEKLRVYDATGTNITAALRDGTRTLSVGETVTLATPKGNATKARFRIQGITQFEKNDPALTTDTEYRLAIQIPSTITQAQGSFEAEVFIDDAWK